MNKKIILSSFASLLFLSQAANAEFKFGSITATPGIMYSTNYVGEFTGTLTNRSKPTYGIDLNLSHDSGVYLYSAYKELKNFPDSSSVSTYGTFDFELCNVLGFAKTVNAVNLDASYENCHVDAKTEENTGTWYLRANYDVSKQLNLGAAYAKNSTDGAKSGTTTYLQDAYKFYGSYNTNLAKATLTYGESDNFTSYYSLGLNKDLLGVNFDLAYWNVDAKKWLNDASPKFYERELLVLSVKKTF